jgi:hypothetical protein
MGVSLKDRTQNLWIATLQRLAMTCFNRLCERSEAIQSLACPEGVRDDVLNAGF